MKQPRVRTSVQLGSPTPWFIAASISLVLGIGMGIYIARFVSHSVVVPGTVTSLEEEEGKDDGKTYFAPVYTFTTQEGKVYAGTSTSASNPASFTVGEAIRVRYDRVHPAKNEIDTFWSLWGMPVVGSLLGGFFLVLGFVLRASQRRKAAAAAVVAK